MLHERVILLTVADERRAARPSEERVERRAARPGVLPPDAPLRLHGGARHPAALAEGGAGGLPIELEDTTFFLGIETLLATRRPGMPLWRERLFVLMSRNAVRATIVLQDSAGTRGRDRDAGRTVTSRR